MAFDNGTATFLVCALSKPLNEKVIEDFVAKKAGSTDRVRDEMELGWVTAKHLLDTNINDDSAFCGGYLTLTLRNAVRKIPSSLLVAECKMEELVMKQANEFKELTRKMKKEIKEDVSARLIETMPPSLSGTTFVEFRKTNTVFVGTANIGQVDAFNEHFSKTTGSELLALTPETICSQNFSYNSDELSRFNFSRKLVDEIACAGTVGQDFLTWLLFIAEFDGGIVKLENSNIEYAVALDGPVLLVADGKGALESVIRKGEPTKSGELQTALDVGKKIKQAKILLACGEEVWSFGFDADSFAFRSVKVIIDKNIDTESIFQERMIKLNSVVETINILFERYVKIVSSKNKFENEQARIKRWLEERSKNI